MDHPRTYPAGELYPGGWGVYCGSMNTPNLSFQQFTRIIDARGNLARMWVRPASAPPGAETADGGWSHGDASQLPPGRPASFGRFGQWLLFVGPKSIWYLLDNIIATLALHEEVRVLDCGSQVDRRHLRSLLKRYPQAFERIKILKAHSPQEAVYLLDHISSIPVPFIALDLLRPFYETSTPLKERKELLKACFQDLRRLQLSTGGCVSIHPPRRDANLGAKTLFELVEEEAKGTFDVTVRYPGWEMRRLFKKAPGRQGG
jgi:hypothetical protein